MDGRTHVKYTDLPWRSGDMQWSSSAQLYPAIVHHEIGLDSLQMDTLANAASCGKGVYEGCVVDETVVQGVEQMPIPGGITGVACMPHYSWQSPHTGQ